MKNNLWKFGAHDDLPKKYLPDDLTPLSGLNVLSGHIPEGSYTTFRTYSGLKVLGFSQHPRRLEETARLAGFDIKVDDEKIRSVLRFILNSLNYHASELRIRITLDLKKSAGDLYFSFEPFFPYPTSLYQNGVCLQTREMKRVNPKAKLTTFLGKANHVAEDLPDDVHEALMIDHDGSILEGLSSNFFAIIGGVIYTEEERVLSGITRSFVIEEAEGLGYNVITRAVHIDEIPVLDEAFITSASREVMPVQKINQIKIGDGKPGKTTLLLMDAYHRRIECEIEPV